MVNLTSVAGLSFEFATAAGKPCFDNRFDRYGCGEDRLPRLDIATSEGARLMQLIEKRC